MTTVQIVALLAASLGVFGPAAQLLHVIRARSARGLSGSTFTILNLSLMCSVLLAIQYATGPALYFATASLVFKMAVLAAISRLAAFGLTLLAGGVAALVNVGPDVVAQAVLTTQYSEAWAFAWGLLLAIAFLPQVVLTHRTRNTRGLSLISLVMSAIGTSLWMVFAVMVVNYAMVFWCGVMLLALLELIRLKLVVRLPEAAAEQRQHETAEEDEERDLDRQRREVMALQPCDRAVIVANDEDEKGEPEAEKQKPEETAHGIPLT